RDFHVTGVQTCALPISREMLGFALSHSTVGLDVEAFRRDPDPMTVGAQVFSARELARLGTLSGEAQRELFRRLWTLKEAYLKARSEERRVGKECRATWT